MMKNFVFILGVACASDPKLPVCGDVGCPRGSSALSCAPDAVNVCDCYANGSKVECAKLPECDDAPPLTACVVGEYPK